MMLRKLISFVIWVWKSIAKRWILILRFNNSFLDLEETKIFNIFQKIKNYRNPRGTYESILRKTSLRINEKKIRKLLPDAVQHARDVRFYLCPTATREETPIQSPPSFLPSKKKKKKPSRKFSRNPSETKTFVGHCIHTPCLIPSVSTARE